MNVRPRLWSTAAATAVLAACWVVGGGCDGDPDPPGDDDSSDPEPVECDEGWIDDGGSCVPEHCGLGPWGLLATDDQTIHVDAAAALDGDGTADAAFTTISAAMDAAGSGDLVAVAAGTYLEQLDLDSDHGGIHLAGRCPELVILDGGSLEGTPVITVEASHLAGELFISDLTVRHGGDHGIGIGSGKVRLDNLVVSDNVDTGIGIYNDSTFVTVSNCLVTHNLPSEDGSGGWGIAIQFGAEAWLDDVRIEDNAGCGLFIDSDGSNAFVDGGVISGSGIEGTGESSRGVQVLWAGNLEAVDTVIEGNSVGGLLVQNEGSTATLDGVVIRDNVPDDQGNWGYGVQVVAGATLDAHSTELIGNTQVGLLVADEGSSATVEAVTIEGTLPTVSGVSSGGLMVQGEASVDAVDVTIRDCALGGLVVIQQGSAATVEGLVVENARPDERGNFGYGVVVQDGAALTLSDATIEGNHNAGIIASGSNATVQLTDVVVRETWRGPETAVAFGVTAQAGATLEAQRLSSEDNEGPGVRAAVGGTLICHDCDLLRNQLAGAALDAATLTLDGVTIEDTIIDSGAGGGVGIVAMSSSSDLAFVPRLELADSTIGPQPLAALWLRGPGSYRIEGNDLGGGPRLQYAASTTVHGDVVFAIDDIESWDGDQGLLLQGNTLHDAGGAAVFLHEARATLTGNTYSGNALDLLQQHCDGRAPADGYLEAPAQSVCPTVDTLYLPWEISLYLDESDLAW